VDRCRIATLCSQDLYWEPQTFGFATVSPGNPTRNNLRIRVKLCKMIK
jgi:hypothetical protein